MSGLIHYFGLDCFPKLLKTIKGYGGLKASLYKLYRMDNLRPGQCVGEDDYGNKYYENKSYFYGRNRWVSTFTRFQKMFSNNGTDCTRYT